MVQHHSSFWVLFSGPPLVPRGEPRGVCLGISGVANLMLIRALGATIRNPSGASVFLSVFLQCLVNPNNLVCHKRAV